MDSYYFVLVIDFYFAIGIFYLQSIADQVIENTVITFIYA